MAIENIQDEQKVEQLYEQYRFLMYNRAYLILHDSQLAEDAVSQSFEKIIRVLHRIEEVNSSRTKNFLVIICENTAKDIYQKRLKFNLCDDFVEEEIAAVSEDPLDIYVDSESVKRIKRALKNLKPIYRDVILLKAAHNLTNEEIVKLLNIPQETVKKRLYRGKIILSRNLQKEELK